ncbi:MAG: Asp23/Gls24 family envelope stress response protein [Ktedonobacterales bacterium]
MPSGTSRIPASTKGAPAWTSAPNGVAGASEWQGKIEVSPRAIATVAGRAVAECYGVVGIAARRPRLGAVELLAPEHYRRGVEVRFTDDHIAIEVYVVLEHGLRITEIAHNIMESVKFAVERTLGLRVVRINVNVQALRVSGSA